MKEFIKWEKQQINGKWFMVSSNVAHVPMIEMTKNGEYKVTGSDGKSRLEKELNLAKRFAIEQYRKMSKFNRKFDKQN